MRTPEEVLAIFAEQQALEAKILDQCATIAHIAKPFAEWGTIMPDRCGVITEKLTDLLDMTQRLIDMFKESRLRNDWMCLESDIEDAIVATVAYREICSSFEESVLRKRLRLSKKLKALETDAKKAIKNNQRWRVKYFKDLFNEDLETPSHLSLVIVTEETK